METVHRWLADLVVVLHFAFVCFVVAGSFLALKWRRILWLQIGAAVWGMLIEFSGWTCPLTPLENWLRQMAGEETSGSDFVARYVLPVLYPEGLTRRSQIVLGVLVIAANLPVYAWLLTRRSAPGGDGL